MRSKAFLVLSFAIALLQLQLSSCRSIAPRDALHPAPKPLTSRKLDTQLTSTAIPKCLYIYQGGPFTGRRYHVYIELGKGGEKLCTWDLVDSLGNHCAAQGHYVRYIGDSVFENRLVDLTSPYGVCGLKWEYIGRPVLSGKDALRIDPPSRNAEEALDCFLQALSCIEDLTVPEECVETDMIPAPPREPSPAWDPAQ